MLRHYCNCPYFLCARRQRGNSGIRIGWNPMGGSKIKGQQRNRNRVGPISAFGNPDKTQIPGSVQTRGRDLSDAGFSVRSVEVASKVSYDRQRQGDLYHNILNPFYVRICRLYIACETTRLTQSKHFLFLVLPAPNNLVHERGIDTG